jgi:hypothetical protein
MNFVPLFGISIRLSIFYLLLDYGNYEINGKKQCLLLYCVLRNVCVQRPNTLLISLYVWDSKSCRTTFAFEYQLSRHRLNQIYFIIWLRSGPLYWEILSSLCVVSCFVSPQLITLVFSFAQVNSVSIDILFKKQIICQIVCVLTPIFYNIIPSHILWESRINSGFIAGASINNCFL